MEKKDHGGWKRQGGSGVSPWFQSSQTQIPFQPNERKEKKEKEKEKENRMYPAIHE